MTTRKPPAARRPARSNRAPGRFAWLTPERAIIGGTVIATVVLLAVIILGSAQTGANRSRVIEGIEEFPGILGGDHQTTPVTYRESPPVGGAHHPAWQRCGVYDEPVRNEHAVHSLEHGAVWITYQPDLPEDQVATLAGITQRGSHRLLSPFPGIDSPIVLTAWGVQLRVDSADDPRVMEFVLKYEQGEQTPERGATCSGGVRETAAELE